MDGSLIDHKEAVAVAAGSADTFRRAGLGAVKQRLPPAVDVARKRRNEKLDGEGDRVGVPEFGAAIDEAMQAACIASCRAVSIDLGDVTFMDSAGLNGLIAAMHVAAKHDCKLVLRNPPPQVRRLFEMTGVGNLFEIVDS